MAFPPDGRLPASAHDHTLRLWDLTPLSDRRPWQARIPEAERQFQLRLKGLNLKPVNP